MKYIITENKANKIMYNYIDERLKDRVTYGPGFDYDKNEETDDMLYFHLTDDSGEAIFDDPIFEYVKKSWYKPGREPIEISKEWENKAPILHVTNLKSYSCCNFDWIFGELWHPVFEQWFKNNFPQFPVKTFAFN